MNKRELKKSIHYTCGEVAAEAAFTIVMLEGSNVELLNQAIVDAARLQDSSLRKVSISFDRRPKDFENKAEYHKERRAYYKKAYAALTDNFNKDLLEIVKKMNAALPAKEEK